MRYWLGIDTSNYTTSAAVVDEDGVAASVKLPLPVKPGERGIRQSDAVFAHVKNLPLVMERIGKVDFTAVGYSAYPRDVAGSYMPCFLAGEAAARAVAAVNGLPVYAFSHQAGHIAAAVMSSGGGFIRAEKPMSASGEKMQAAFPYREGRLDSGSFLAFHVSGGTTELLLVKNQAEGTRYQIDLLGGTLDLNAGQLIDRIGVRMGLCFPCGPALETLASDRIPPRPKICVRDLSCNLSGIENQAAAMLEKGTDREICAAYVLEAVGETLSKLTEHALAAYGTMPVLYAGGVMSNRRIRNKLTSRYDAYFAEPQYASDNAAGCALLCRDRYLSRQPSKETE